MQQGWAQSKDDNKAFRAHSFLQWMIQEQERGQNKYLKPNFKAYTLVMSICSRPNKQLSLEKKRRIFEIITQTFEDLARGDNGLNPGSISYRIMLTACKNLLPPGKERQHHIKAIFEHCCRVGVVDERIYEAFCDTADEETRKEIVGLDKKSWMDLPLDWRNK